MKKITILLLSILSLSAAAQEIKEQQIIRDTTYYISNRMGRTNDKVIRRTVINTDWNGKKDTTLYVSVLDSMKNRQSMAKVYPKKRQDAHWRWDAGKFMGVNIMYSGLVQNLSNMQLPDDASSLALLPKSIGVDINFIDMVIYSYRRFGIVSGMGIESNNFRFSNNVSLAMDANGRTIIDNSFTERGIHLTKSKLTTTYLNIPLLFQLHLGSGENRHSGGFISAGAIVGCRLQSYTKTDSRELGKEKHFSDFNLRNFHVGFQATVGYGGFNLTAKYYPQSIFRTGFGPQIQQVNIGIGYNF